MGFLIRWLVAMVYKRLRGWEGLGGGDPKLLAAIGAWLGWQQLPIVLLGAGLSGLAAVLTHWLRGHKVTGTDRLQLGTLMAIAPWPIWLLIARSNRSLACHRAVLFDTPGTDPHSLPRYQIPAPPC